ncbi:phage baseplate plug protein [Acinetobacter sp.]|uniref:phage baseplate plug family protein n=1 Tax=Acinetobacter sp. TaxID=472 RepID=UPI003982BC16
MSGLAMNPNLDLLEQHQHLIKGSLFVTNSNKDESQGFYDLGSKIQLYWSDPS